MKEEIRKRAVAYQNEWMKDLGELIAIDSSFKGESTVTAEFPFGEGPAKALKAALALSERMGFAVENVDNYAGTVTYGNGEDCIGVVSHLDVVPAGKGWETDPFELTVKDGVMYGRGVIDDKGPFIASLYALRILRDMNIPLKKGIRLIVGTNEESGSLCMEYYREHRDAPKVGFTPDGEYPLIHGEKGIFHGKAIFPEEDTPILSFTGGEVYNAVISECTAVLDGKKADAEALKASIKEEDTCGYGSEVTILEDGNIQLVVKGLAAHGSTPYLGVNAAVSAAKILCGFLGEKAGKMMSFIANDLGRETDGATLGMAMNDETNCPLTLNLGKCGYDGKNNWLGLDMRFPVTFRSADFTEKLNAMLDKYGLTIEDLDVTDPLYVPLDNPLIDKLMQVYRDVTGDTENGPKIIGGGTYAKELPGDYVAFGVEKVGREGYNMHTIAENFSIDEMIEQTVICAMAMVALAE